MKALSLAWRATPNLTFSMCGRARDEWLAELAGKVGAATLAKVGAGEAEEVCATGVNKVAADAEGTSHIPLAYCGLGQVTKAKGLGFKSPSSHQTSDGQVLGAMRQGPALSRFLGWRGDRGRGRAKVYGFYATKALDFGTNGYSLRGCAPGRSGRCEVRARR